MGKVIDLTREITNGMAVYPGDSEMRLYQTKFLESDGYSNHQLQTGMHVGTHIDGPMHMIGSDTYISQISPDKFIGEGCLLDVRGQAVFEMKPEYSAAVKPNSIVVLYTGQESNFGTARYFNENPVVAKALARHLVHKQIKMLCIDSPSPDRYPFCVHKLLLRSGILIAENLMNLDQLLRLDRFEVMAFPLKIRADGSPARIIAREL